MIDIEADIISGKSIGNIYIGHNILDYLDEIYEKYHVTLDHYNAVGNNREAYQVYILNNGIVTINTTLYGKIVSLSCNQDYKGYYKNKIYSGISMHEVFRFSSYRAILYDEALYLDHDLGMGLLLPLDFSMCDKADDISPNCVFNNICVHLPYVL